MVPFWKNKHVADEKWRSEKVLKRHLFWKSNKRSRFVVPKWYRFGLIKGIFFQNVPVSEVFLRTKWNVSEKMSFFYLQKEPQGLDSY